MKLQKATISVKEASRILGISFSNMYALVRADKVPNIKIGKRYLIPLKSFYEWLERITKGGEVD
ncbi:MAG: helix-turn-helix domain-containing protein [Ruminococcus sp.]|nr:helix-turn-helix domain-containing protein [Ruminococcus sp.]